jgi:hypothetical protein
MQKNHGIYYPKARDKEATSTVETKFCYTSLMTFKTIGCHSFLRNPIIFRAWFLYVLQAAVFLRLLHPDISGFLADV